MQFQEAISKKALQEYGTLGKSFMEGTIEEPQNHQKQITIWLTNL
jgi:hypothetical protein